MRKPGDLSTRDAPGITRTETWDTGQVISQTGRQLVPRAADNFHYFAGMCPQADGHTHPTPTRLNDDLFHPMGVCALSSLWNLPVMTATDNARLGWAMRRAVEAHYDGTVAFLASGSLSHRFAQNGLAPAFAFKVWSPFLEYLDHAVIAMWQRGDWADFCEMLPEYASKGHGEGFMHDTAMLLGALGWGACDGRAEVVTPYFGASGTCQINAVFPVTPQDGAAIPAAQASVATGYRAFPRLSWT